MAGDSMSAWQPIETAPRDGTWFVIFIPEFESQRYEVGRYNPYYSHNYEEVEGGLYKKVAWVGYEWDGFNNFGHATHWMPLPEPPK